MNEALSPPFVLLGEAGEVDALFASLDKMLNWFCLPTDVGVAGRGQAFDARGRILALNAESDDDPIVVKVLPVERPDALEDLLRTAMGGRPTKFGLIDDGVGLEGLLRARWRVEHSREPYPGDISKP